MEKKIKAMLKKVQDRKTELAELNGEKKQLLKQLQDEGCKSIADAEKQIKKEERNVTRLEKELEVNLKALESDYDWGE